MYFIVPVSKVFWISNFTVRHTYSAYYIKDVVPDTVLDTF